MGGGRWEVVQVLEVLRLPGRYYNGKTVLPPLTALQTCGAGATGLAETAAATAI